jgi:hypothetical protein
MDTESRPEKVSSVSDSEGKAKLNVFFFFYLSLWVSRAIIVTDAPLASIDNENFIPADLSYSLFPPGSKAGNKESPIYGIHQSHESMACPPNQCTFYIPQALKKKNVTRTLI